MVHPKSAQSIYKQMAMFIVWMTLSLILTVGFSMRQPVTSSTVSMTQLEQQGRDFYQAGQFEAAVQRWQAIINQETDPLKQAQAFANLSLSLQKLGDWDAARIAIQSSLSLLESLSNHHGMTRLLAQAQALNIQGNLNFAQGKYDQALENWKQAETLYHSLENDAGITQTLLNQVQVLQALGLYRRAEQTLVEIHQFLKIQPNLSLKFSQLLHLNNILRVLGKLGNINENISEDCIVSKGILIPTSVNSELTASQVSLELLQTAKQLNSPQELNKAQFGFANTARAIYQQKRELEDKKTAKTAAKMALVCYQQAAGASSSIIQVKAQLNTLSLLLELQKEFPNDANFKIEKLNLDRIQQQIHHLPLSRTAIYAQLDLAKNLMKLTASQPDLEAQIEPILLRAMIQAEQLTDPRVKSYVLGNLGHFYEQQQQWKKAKKYTENALILSKKIPADEISYQWQWQLGRILKKQQPLNINPAIAAYAGAVQTLKSLRQDLVAIRQDVQFDFRDQVEPVYRELVDLLLQSEHPTLENLKQARDVIESLQLAELDNFFRDACLDAQPQTIDQIDPNAVVIYGIILTDRLEVIASLPQGSLFHYHTLISQSQLTQTLKKLRFLLQKPYPDPKAKQLSQQVYNGLLLPLATQLQGDETLVFVLDGELRNIPIAALSDGKQYLIEQHPVVIAPGLQLLAPQPLAQPFNVLSAGLVEPPQPFQDQFSILPNIPQELQKIEDVGVEMQTLLNEAFNRENLQEQATSQSFDIMHLATHGQFSSQAEQTFILAADGPINIQQLDQLFRSRERNQPDAIDLLVLSACETAPGDNRAVLGLAGMAVRAGASSTLASLWSLNDESAVEFMGHFYQHLVNGESRAEALRQAQLMFLNSQNQYDAPVYWAAYILVGNWS